MHDIPNVFTWGETAFSIQLVRLPQTFVSLYHLLVSKRDLCRWNERLSGLRAQYHGTLNDLVRHKHGFGCARKFREGGRQRVWWCPVTRLVNSSHCLLPLLLHTLTETKPGPLLHDPFEYGPSDNECDPLDSFHPQTFENDSSSAPSIFRSAANGPLGHQSSIHPIALQPANGYGYRTSSASNSGNDLQ